MQFDTSTPRAEVTIQGTTFTLPQPFTPGHVCSEGEASQLNQLLAENVRNNFAGKMKARKEKGEADYTQADLDAYVSEYEMGVRKQGNGEARLSPVEREARRIARDRVTAALKARNQTVDKENMERLVSQASQKPEIVREAEKRLKAIEKISLEELDLDVPTAEAA